MFFSTVVMSGEIIYRDQDVNMLEPFNMKVYEDLKWPLMELLFVALLHWLHFSALFGQNLPVDVFSHYIGVKANHNN